MRSCVFLLLLLAAAASCASAPEPRPEPPVQPLVIGTSTPAPVAPVTEHAPAPDPKPIAPTTSLAIPARDPRLAHGGQRTAAQPDEVLYYAGLDHELAGNNTGARRAYYELIKQYPSSKLVAFAYFAFGELFLAESENDPSKAQLAEQAYREVLKYPPAQNPLYVEAQRRLAELKLTTRRP